MEHRYMNEGYAIKASELINKVPELEHLRGANVTIGYLSSDAKKKSRGKAVFGQCEKVADKNKWSIPFDFLIVIYDRNCIGLKNDQIEILLVHELMHIGIEETETGMRYYCIPHDLQDFRKIVEKYGADWSQEKA